MATLGLSKVFILDKYFTELQKFWETEKKLQDASSSNEAVHLQQRLKSLSSELVTLRNRLHVDHAPIDHQPNANTVADTGKPLKIEPTTNTTTTALNLNATNLNLRNSSTLTTTSLHNSPDGSGVGGGGGPQSTIQQNVVRPLGDALDTNTATFNNIHHIACNNIKNNSGSLTNSLPKSAIGTTSVRNRNIPHPLPHQINDKCESKTNGQKALGFSSTSCTTQLALGNNTLPLRSATFENHLGHFATHTQCGFTTSKLAPANSNAIANSDASYSNHNIQMQSTLMNDLIHLTGPLTEDAVMRTLQARFNEKHYFTNVGPILLAINPYLDVGNPLTLSSTRSLHLAPSLCKIVQEAVRQQAETGYPQAIILSGSSGAGKTHCSMLLLRQLFAVAGGGPETDAFKHLAAAFTVLRSLGSAKTTANSESSRIGQFIEVQVTDGALYRTKIHCYFLDQTRVIRPLPKEKNYHIFYQMLAGLSSEEKIKLNLDGYSTANLRYLQSTDGEMCQNDVEDAARFNAWKTCLGILGIPFLDVVRVLAAVLLLGNVEFIEGQGLEVDVKNESELNAVASLLGVPPAALFRGLTTRTHAPLNGRGQLVKSVCDANMSNMTRDCLAKALYCRTVSTIVRRANSLKRLGSTLGTLSSDSNDSVHNHGDANSQHASTVGGNSGSKSMTALNNAVRHATDGFIGILDMFGFEEPSPHAQLEHLCINLCAETMQHFYNTHIFKSSVESCRDEGIGLETEVDYIDNVPCIDLISSLRTGLLSMLDAECSVRGTAENYVAKIRVQHRNSPRLDSKTDPRRFAIRHFAGRVEYDATNFLDTNRDVVPDDLVAVFYKHTCNFGFATHLFGSELKALYALQNVPCGLSFRISPTSHTDLLNGNEPVSTLTQDFHTRLDNLLRTLVHARPHFVRCIRSNSSELGSSFERLAVVKQIRALQVLETVNLMASGFPHRMRFKQFNARYRMLAPLHIFQQTEEKALEDCTLLLLRIAMEHAVCNASIVDSSTVMLNWAVGKRHIFLTEGIRQHLEHLRSEIRIKSATLIGAAWRGWHWRRKAGHLSKTRTASNPTFPAITKVTSIAKANPVTNGCSKVNSESRNLVSRPAAKVINANTFQRPRPQPIACTPPPDLTERCDSKYMQQTCSFYGLDLERPPPVPPSRSYVIMGNFKLGYPHSRIMKMNYPDDAAHNPLSAEQLKKGEMVIVIGTSTTRRGYLVVEKKGHKSLHVPFHYLEMVRCSNVLGKNMRNVNGGNLAQTHLI